MDFYQKVREAQDSAESSLKIDPIRLKRGVERPYYQRRFLITPKARFSIGYRGFVRSF